MDFSNFGIFAITWLTLRRSFALADAYTADPSACHSLLCASVGYRDDWELMDTMRSAKMYLSLCVAIQLLKIIKFMKGASSAAFVPTTFGMSPRLACWLPSCTHPSCANPSAS